MTYLLCIDCWTAWVTAPEVCYACGKPPVVCNPNTIDGWQWYQVAVHHKLQGVQAVLATPNGFKRRSIARGIRARGNVAFSVRAAVM